MSEALPVAEAIITDPPPLKKEKPGPLEYMRQWPLRIIVGLTLLFLYLPLITLMVFSFNNNRRNIVWQGFTFDYYE
jgi:spermidine/putrescine transport system permease protein